MKKVGEEEAVELKRPLSKEQVDKIVSMMYMTGSLERYSGILNMNVRRVFAMSNVVYVIVGALVFWMVSVLAGM